MRSLFILFAPLLLLVACKTDQSSPRHVRDYLPIRITQSVDTLFYSDLGLYERPDSLSCSDATITHLDGERFVVEMTGDTPLSSMRVSASECGSYEVPVLFNAPKTFELLYSDPNKASKEVTVKGEMTLWQEKPCTFDKAKGQWIYSFSTLPGRYQYVFLVDGEEKIDPHNAKKITSDIGTTNSLFEYKGPSQEQTPFLQPQPSPAGKLTLKVRGPLPDRIVALIDNKAVEVAKKTGQIELEWDAAAFSGHESLRIWASAKGVRSNDVVIPLLNGEVIERPDGLPTYDPRAQVMYFVLVDRFNNGNKSNDEPVEDAKIHPMANYQGGDLQGVLDKIEDGYFESLGVNAIWLSPITQNPLEAYREFPEPHRWYTGYHGYWPISSSKVDHRFGDDAVLQALVDKAHEKGIAIYLDFICNHVHEKHPMYADHPERATDLYLEDSVVNIRIWEDQRLTTWFDDFLPSLDFSQQEVIDMQVDSAFYWLKKFGLDGYRHDASKHIPLSFWRALTEKLVREVVEGEGRNVFQIGETYGARELIASYIGSGALDAQFDFPFYFDTRNVLLEDDQAMSDLADILQQSLDNFGHQHPMGNITGNHDQPRFISLAGGGLKRDENDREAGFSRTVEVGDPVGYDKLKLLQAINVAVPGIPVNYYGDEIGMPGAGDPDSRRMMRFSGLSEKEQGTFDAVQKLLQMRRAQMPLLYGTTEVVYADKKALVIRRQYLDQVILACFNKSQEQHIIVIEGGEKAFKSLLSQEDAKVGGDYLLKLELPSMGYDFLISTKK